jgi:hypothetical protein
MNSIVALPIAAAVPTAAPAMLSHPSDDRLVAAAEGLFATKAAIDQLYREYPDCCGDDGEVDERADCRALLALQDQHVETLVTVAATSNAGLQAKASVVAAKFMADGFRPDHKRLAVSLADDLVGGARAAIPAMPAPAAPKEDAELIELDEQIFEEWNAGRAFADDLKQSDLAFGEVLARLQAEGLSSEEFMERLGATPESQRYDYFDSLQDSHLRRMEHLLEKMWAIPATTPEGREVKVQVLLSCVLDWREHDEVAQWEVKMARDLLFELVGGEPAQRRNQFA